MNATAKYLTTAQAAARLGVTSAHVGYLIRSGRLPATRIGAWWLLRRADVDAAQSRPRGTWPRRKLKED